MTISIEHTGLSPDEHEAADAFAARQADLGVSTVAEGRTYAAGQIEYANETREGRNKSIPVSQGDRLVATGRRGRDTHGDPAGGWDEANRPIWHPHTDGVRRKNTIPLTAVRTLIDSQIGPTGGMPNSVPETPHSREAMVEAAYRSWDGLET